MTEPKVILTLTPAQADTLLTLVCRGVDDIGEEQDGLNQYEIAEGRDKELEDEFSLSQQVLEIVQDAINLAQTGAAA